ncbi:transglycosylase SLT domain-containing protein, partial [Bacteroides heparinolyticus]|uniref:transglycosylase SLT domain-containing protein n=1 Tax=Prevotella heparinolytica TaxID=28113 RepID=UPI0035A103ED
MKFYTKKERTYIGNAPITHIHNISDLVRKYKRITVVLLGILAVSILINIYLVFAKTEPQSAQEAAGVIMVTLPATTAAETTAEPTTEAIEVAQQRYYDVPLDKSLQDHIRELAAYYNIDMAMILAVIEVESDYRADVISEGGDYGLMQISSFNHEWLSEAYGFADFLDPYQNTAAGALMLSQAIKNSDTMHGALMV